MSSRSHKLFSFVLVLSATLLKGTRGVEISSYARVSRNGDSISLNADRGRGNDPTADHVTYNIDSTLIDKQNTTLRQQKATMVSRGSVAAAATAAPTSTAATMAREEVAEEQSEGRAIKSNYYFPLSNFLTKATQTNSNSYRNRNEKEGRLIVYPSYTQNIDQTRRRYDMPPLSTGQVAQKRFSPSEAYAGTVYKLKHPEKFPGYQYPTPTMAPAPPPPPPPMMMMMTSPPATTSAPPPPPPQYLPPSKFSQPIVVADYDVDDDDSAPPLPPSSSSSSSSPPSHFMPTIIPETTAPNPIIDLLAFDKKVNTSFMPPELHAIKDSIDNNHAPDPTNEEESSAVTGADLHRFPPNDHASYADDDLHKFPPNINSAYLPPPSKMKSPSLVNSYVPPPSGDKEAKKSSKDEQTNVSPIDLHKFPPNVDSAYLPPAMMKSPSLINSYIPPPSGEKEAKKISGSEEQQQQQKTNVSPIDLHKFPPNVDSAYLPPPAMMESPALVNSYLPPPSGESEAKNNKPDTRAPAIDLHQFPPNIDSAYLPPEMMKYVALVNSYLPPPSGEVDAVPQQMENNIDDGDSNSNAMMYVPPKDLHNFPPNVNSFYLPPEMMKQQALINSYLPPASGDPSSPLSPPPPPPPPPSPASMNQQMAVNAGGMEMSGPYIYRKPPGASSMMMPPPPMMMSMPPTGMMDMGKDMGPDMSMPSGPPMDDHDHDHDHHHDHHPWDSFSYYDDHHHHHHHDEETTTTTTPAPAPEEPRVKKYSYYYLGRKLWYIPLYFTLWFCLYVAALIVRSIGRHKVDLPNHYVSRSLHDMSNRELTEKINKMTAFTMAQIEDFKEKYL